jgi:hypothetical protein
MMLQTDAKVVFLRNTAESWAQFEIQDGVTELPKYEYFIMIRKGKVGKTVDYRVLPSLRTEENEAEASRWATHFAILALFLKSEKSHMFVCEDSITLNATDISKIEKIAESPGLHILASKAQAYIVDKETAEIILENAYLYYASWDIILDDLQKLNLINKTQTPLLEKMPDSYTWLYNYLFIVLLLLACIGLFYMLCPFNGFYTQKVVSLAEVLTTEESVMSAEGTGVSSHQDTMINVD